MTTMFDYSNRELEEMIDDVREQIISSTIASKTWSMNSAKRVANIDPTSSG